MQTTALALLLAAAAGSAQAAITFKQFPATGIACPNSDASADLISDTAALKAAAEAARNDVPVEESAANIASGQCTSLKLPYYVTRTKQANGEAAGLLSFAWDAASETIYYCTAQGLFSTSGNGYPDSCKRI
ncbi:uncharacterized protein BKCO1_5000132 [Diplodia corticola]|uniref:Uncharacterized protein n=1 Tax=Diplodia corticola TaxID=236234 RepID=A0A1J9RCU5_9PEZI|nr:uncharacterized protein BKCO1_5000132 [Diplodia corticola]OJD37930.1 hypothetical protein BKCO1_5000132 [Diplodia corticola]